MLAADDAVLAGSAVDHQAGVDRVAQVVLQIDDDNLGAVGGKPALHAVEPSEQDVWMDLGERVGSVAQGVIGPVEVVQPAVQAGAHHPGSAQVGGDLGAGEVECDVLRTSREARIGGAGRVYLVPAGSLHLVNFMALTDARGRFLVEDDRLLHVILAERALAAGPSASTPSPSRSSQGASPP